MKKRFIYVINTPARLKELVIHDDEIIENADGELDCPLNIILHRNYMEWDDLIQVKAVTVSLIQEDFYERKMIRSISFENLYYYRE